MKKRTPIHLALSLPFLLSSPGFSEDEVPYTSPALTEVYSKSEALPRFPDFGFMLSPEDYHGRVFVLSQNFPTEQPPMDAVVKKILEIDFKNDWRAYLEAVREYVYEGNIDHGGYEND